MIASILFQFIILGSLVHASSPIIDKVKRINGGLGAKLEQAYNDLEAKDVIHGLYKAEEYCGGANSPELKEGCQLLKDKIKTLGAENVPPYQIAQDYEKFQANENPSSIGQYQEGKKQLGQMRTAYGKFEIFDHLDADLDKKLPALQIADANAKKAEMKQKAMAAKEAEAQKQKALADEQFRDARMAQMVKQDQSQSQDNLAAKQANAAKLARSQENLEIARERQQKSEREQQAKENSNPCQAIRARKTYCVKLTLIERAQMNLAKQKEIEATGGVVKLNARYANADYIVNAKGQVKSAQTSYKQLTGTDLSPASCKIDKNQDTYQVNLAPGFLDSVEAEEKQTCGSVTN